jgi:hypothetical protein
VVRQEIVNNKILVVNCGRFIKYALIEIDNLHLLENSLTFIDIDIVLKPETEIYMIWSTNNKDHI